LTEFIRGNRIIRNKQQVRAYNATPLCCHLTMNQTIVNSCQSNIWHFSCPPSLLRLAFIGQVKAPFLMPFQQALFKKIKHLKSKSAYEVYYTKFPPD
jgi:hypothetical protein